MTNGEGGLGERATTAARWSILTQVAMKLVGPVTTMVLARLLTPEAFGVVASATMVVSLADLLSDAGFQSYLVQHRFEDENEESLCACVAFWTNLAISLAVVAVVFVACDQLARIAGSAGYGNALFIASLSLPMTSLVSVQTALFRKKLDFKPLFGAGLGYSVVNLVAAVSLALLGFDYWSMILGALLATAFRMIWLTARSSWRPSLYYSFAKLRVMLSYGMWVLGESAATWVNTWAGTFFIGTRMDATSVGYYKTSTSISASVMGVITGAVMPIAFSALSAVQDDKKRFEQVFLKMQTYLALCVVPVGIGCFVYRDLLTLLLLGEQWVDTSLFLGLWMLSGCIVVAFGYICSEAYRALGRPKLCVVVQFVYLVPFLPALYIGAGIGYDSLSWLAPAARLALPCINLCVLRAFAGISPLAILRNCGWFFFLAAAAMIPGLLVTSVGAAIWVEAIAAIFSVLVYIVLLFAIGPTRCIVVDLVVRMGCSKFLPRLIRRASEN